MLRWVIVCVTAVLLLGGCNSFPGYVSSSKAINGNNSGGIVPATVTDENEQGSAAQAHCQQYSKQMRVTARPADTGGKLIFVCEAPGTPPPGAATPQADPSLPPGVRSKKR